MIIIVIESITEKEIYVKSKSPLLSKSSAKNKYFARQLIFKPDFVPIKKGHHPSIN
jgi:hypothetical protein